MIVAILGDSISSDGEPFPNWARRLSATVYDADTAVVFCGTNDFTTAPYASALATAEGNIASIVNQLAAIGKRVVLVAPLPRNGGTPDPVLAAALLGLGSWMHAATGRMVDPYPFFDDGSGGMNPAFAYDMEHPNANGATILAALVQTMLLVTSAPPPAFTLAGSVGGGQVTATWANEPDSHPQDWIGLFHPGDPSTAYVAWSWVNGAQPSTGTNWTVAVPSGSVSYPAPASGTYQFRLLVNNTFTVLATSPNFVV